MNILVNIKPKYKIRIGEGIVNKKTFSKGFVITDKNVYSLYKKFIGEKYFCIEPGESSKNIDIYSKILKLLSDEDTIIAFGGGVVGDIAGFVASTYKRGIKFIQVPTTLMAMVDSSIGGKNGVDLGQKKNYVGTIYQPAEVIIDTKFLKTLSKKELKNGYAEIVKYNYLLGKPSLKELQGNKLKNVIYESCKAKAKTIEKDPFDLGYRHILNFGHTIGHGIELLGGLSHGEAISIGMIKELEIACKMEITSKKAVEKIRENLKLLGLPTELPKNINKNKFLDILKADKKGKFIFSINKNNYSVKISEKEIKGILK